MGGIIPSLVLHRLSCAPTSSSTFYIKKRESPPLPILPLGAQPGLLPDRPDARAAWRAHGAAWRARVCWPLGSVWAFTGVGERLRAQRGCWVCRAGSRDVSGNSCTGWSGSWSRGQGFCGEGILRKNKKISPFVKSSGVKVLAVTKVLGRWRCARSIRGAFIRSLLRALWAAMSLLLGVRQHLFRGRSGFQKYLGRN